MDPKITERINQLVRTLKASGLAASTEDAFELAKRIVTGKQQEEEKKEPVAEEEKRAEKETQKPAETEALNDAATETTENRELKTEEPAIKAKDEALQKYMGENLEEKEAAEEEERLPTVDELEDMPGKEGQNRDSPGYDITKEKKTLREIMGKEKEDAEKEEDSDFVRTSEE